MLKKGFTHEIKDLDTTKGIVIAYANAYNNEDSDEDISMPGSFTKTISEGIKKLRVLKNHDTWSKLGVPLEVDASDPYGLLTTTQFNMSKQAAKDTFTDIQLELANNQQSDLSIGYKVIKRDSVDNRRITEYKLLEYSFLDFLGANPLAIVQGVKDIKDYTSEQIISDIDQLTKMYNAKYSDGKLKSIELAVKTLLILKPEASTLKDEAVAKQIKEYIEKTTLKNYLHGN